MGDVALSGVPLWHGGLSRNVAGAATVEAGIVGGGSNGQWHRQAWHRRWWR
jgi:hypothetical protein